MITLLAAVLFASTPTTISVTPAGFASAVEPQAAVAADGTVFVAFGMGKALYCSVSHNRGVSYDAPVEVANAGELSLGMRRGPRVAVSGKSIVISAVYGAQGKGRDGELSAWRSVDGGKSWNGPVIVNDVPAATREGLHAMAAGPSGQLACVWLDLRVKGTTIYGSTSADGGKSWSPNFLVYASPDGTVCQCCHPSVTYGPDGRLYVMWRNVIDGNRDLYVASSSDGKRFGSAQKLGSGTWPLKGCPMDGGGIAIMADGTLFTAWRRETTIYACRPGQRETTLGDGEQPWAAAGPDGAYLVWLERRGGAVRLLNAAGATSDLAWAGDDPVVAAGPNGPVIAVWTSPNNGIRSAVITKQRIANRPHASPRDRSCQTVKRRTLNPQSSART